MEQKALKIPGEDFTLIIKKGVPKTVIVISKKVAKLAVDRNRIRRLFKEALRSLNFKGQTTVIVKKNIAQYKKEQVQKALEKLLTKYV
ncbi:MAG: ribonuclease P protein component [Candidatus Curtissbacteria bacterium]|nr:ribonuclease P protein component [Candidatus Curtissbacteria bacterium]